MHKETGKWIIEGIIIGVITMLVLTWGFNDWQI